MSKPRKSTLIKNVAERIATLHQFNHGGEGTPYTVESEWLWTVAVNIYGKSGDMADFETRTLTELRAETSGDTKTVVCTDDKQQETEATALSYDEVSEILYMLDETLLLIINNQNK